MFTASVEKHVREACERPENIFGAPFFEEHLAVVADCAARLARQLGADAEAVELAAYLHDLSAVCDPATLAGHAQASADLARQLLAGLGYGREGASRVADAIALHAAPLRIGSASAEAVCLSNADAVARIVRPAYWLYFAFKVRGLDFEGGRHWLAALFEGQWREMIEPAREMAAAQYRTAMDLLRG